MSDLTPEGLEELKRLEAKATPAPWRYEPWHVQEGSAAVIAPAGWIIVQTSSDSESNFIAALRNAAPALIRAAKENEKLRAEIHELQDLVTASEERANARGCEITQLRERIAKAEGVVEAARANGHTFHVTQNGCGICDALAAYSKET